MSESSELLLFNRVLKELEVYGDSDDNQKFACLLILSKLKINLTKDQKIEFYEKFGTNFLVRLLRTETYFNLAKDIIEQIAEIKPKLLETHKSELVSKIPKLFTPKLLKLKPDDLVKYLAENDLPEYKSLPKTVIETIKTLLKTKNLKLEVIEPLLNACNSHSGKLDLESQLLAANRACIEVKIWLELGSTENNRQYKYEFLLCCFELLEKSTSSIIDVETDESIPISDDDLDLMFKVSTKTNEMLIAVLEEMSQLGNSEEIYKYRKDEKYIDQSCKSVFDEWELDIMPRFKKN